MVAVMETFYPRIHKRPIAVLLHSFGKDSTKVLNMMQGEYVVIPVNVPANETTKNWLILIYQNIKFAYYAFKTAKNTGATYIATGLKEEDFMQSYLWYLPAFLKICQKIAEKHGIQIIHPLLGKGDTI